MKLDKKIAITTFDKNHKKLVSSLWLMNRPQKGWIFHIRNLLGMTLEQVAKRMNLTAARVGTLERSETGGSPTLRSMEKIASAMNCTFVYSLVPNEKIAEMKKKHALKKAAEIVSKANVQMEYEDQALDKKELEKNIESLSKKIFDDSIIWDD